MPEDGHPQSADPETQQAFEAGLTVGGLFVQMFPKHEEHGNPVDAVAFTSGVLYQMIARGDLPPPDLDTERTKRLLTAFGSGWKAAYDAAHGQLPGQKPDQPAVPTAPKKSDHDVMFG